MYVLDFINLEHSSCWMNLVNMGEEGGGDVINLTNTGTQGEKQAEVGIISAATSKPVYDCSVEQVIHS